jgi:hypothetical protein
MKPVLKLLVLAGLWIAAAGSVQAHRYNAALTTIEHNPRSGSLEVIHRFYHHDLAGHLHALFGPSGGTDTTEGEARFRAYIEARFELRDTNGDPIVLSWIGTEYSGDFLTVYQEAPNTAPPGTLVIRNELMLELFTNQTNSVSVNLNGVKQNLIFDRNQPVRTLTTSP